jgi:predicted glycogen debranching enzyme
MTAERPAQQPIADPASPNASSASGTPSTATVSIPPANTPASPRPAGLDLEWLEADGLGGYASGTVSGTRTRRYHALLLTATQPPTGRLVLINGVEAWLDNSSPGDAETRQAAPLDVPLPVPLSTQHYAPDVFHPDGWRRITGFEPTPWPTWHMRLANGVSLTHDIFAAGDGGDIILRWRLDPPSGSTLTNTALPDPATPTRLNVRPLLSVRDYHSLHHRNDTFNFQASGSAGRISWRPYGDRPSVSVLSNGDYRHEPEWFEQFLYDEERARGMDATEDLASPGIFTFDLRHEAAVMILRAGDSRDVRVLERVAQAEAHNRERRGNAQPADHEVPASASTTVPRPALARAAESYFAERGHGATVLAGFPWFTDWGRDTFISLRGLTLCTGRLDLAAAILSEWASSVSEGMLPNRFTDTGEVPEYNSVDASLWYVIALDAYLQTGHASAALTRTLRGAAEAILDGYRQGTRFRIGMQADGLVHAGVPGSQLTWMDARIGLTAVTPRIGKPVEIQALWINALRIAATWQPAWGALADQAQTAFRARFINPENGALFDIVDVDGEPGKMDPSIRPNQIFAAGGLPYTIVDAETACRVIDQVDRELLTPLGLRTLAPGDPRYVSHYIGPPDVRDGAYHQGTVWPWLIGPFVEAWLKCQMARPDANPAALRETAHNRFVAPLLEHLAHAGLGHVSEIADGDAPHTPRGAPFQAWSLAELLRVEDMLHQLTPSAARNETGKNVASMPPASAM